MSSMTVQKPSTVSSEKKGKPTNPRTPKKTQSSKTSAKQKRAIKKQRKAKQSDPQGTQDLLASRPNEEFPSKVSSTEAPSSSSSSMRSGPEIHPQILTPTSSSPVEAPSDNPASLASKTPSRSSKLTPSAPKRYPQFGSLDYDLHIRSPYKYCQYSTPSDSPQLEAPDSSQPVNLQPWAHEQLCEYTNYSPQVAALSVHAPTMFRQVPYFHNAYHAPIFHEMGDEQGHGYWQSSACFMPAPPITYGYGSYGHRPCRYKPYGYGGNEYGVFGRVSRGYESHGHEYPHWPQYHEHYSPGFSTVSAEQKYYDDASPADSPVQGSSNVETIHEDLETSSKQPNPSHSSTSSRTSSSSRTLSPLAPDFNPGS